MFRVIMLSKVRQWHLQPVDLFSTKVVLVCLLYCVLHTDCLRVPHVTSDLQKPSAIPKTSSIEAISTLSTLPSVTCLNRSLDCCLRTVTADQLQLDLLDSDTPDYLTSSPTECSKQMDVFLISTGIDDNDVFRDAIRDGKIIIEPDCVVENSTWTPIRDQSGEGTIMSGLLGWPFGLSPNIVVHMIKTGEYWNTGTSASVICGVNQVRSWLRKYPCKKAIAVTTQGVLQPDRVDILHPICVAVRSLIHDFGDRVVFLTFPEESVIGNETNYPIAYTPPGNLPEVISISVDWGHTYDAGNRYNFTNIFNIVTGPSTDIFAANSLVLVPHLNNTIAAVDYFDSAVAVVASVLAEYWLAHSHLTGNQLRDMILNNDESDVHVSGVLPFVPPGVVNKRLRYRCTTGCEPCKNGGVLVNDNLLLKPDRAVCACPRESTGQRCETLNCPTNSTCPFAHPGDCGKYVTCTGGRPVTTSCGTNGCEQMQFDVVKQRCRPRCEATVRRGCLHLLKCI